MFVAGWFDLLATKNKPLTNKQITTSSNGMG